MDIIKRSGLLIMMIFSFGCHGQNKSSAHIKLAEVYKKYAMNINEIKKHLNLQDHMEKSEDGNSFIYNYSEEDILIALPVISQGLIDKGFKPVNQTKFDQEIKNIFGDIAGVSNHKIKVRNKLTTLFAEEGNEQDEFDYTIDNIFISKEYRFITRVPLLGDFIEFTDSNHYRIDLHPKLIALNKYLLNNSKADLAYLLSEDSLFLKTLVRSFGYTKEPAINNLVMNDYMNLDENHIITIGEIIFIKNSKGVLEIKEELLKWIADHTRVNDNRALEALDCYAYALFNSSNSDIFTRDPYRLFSVNEKRKIVAYIANTYLPLYYKLGPSNPAIWPAATIIENQLVEDEGLADYLKKNNYFSLPALKHEMEPEN